MLYACYSSNNHHIKNAWAGNFHLKIKKGLLCLKKKGAKNPIIGEEVFFSRSFKSLIMIFLMKNNHLLKPKS